MSRVLRFAIVALLGATLAGCAARTGIRSQSELLPRPGGHIEVGTIENRSGQQFDVDAIEMLGSAMSDALREQGLAWSPAAGDDRFLLNLAILEYRPGSAFKRWLVPGYGSTVLRVEGTLTDVHTRALAATILHERSVHWGGAYTIGAWKAIFLSVARDIAADLQTRIERGGQFVVAVKARAEQPDVPAPAPDATRVRLAGVDDRRPDRGRIGERQAAFGVSMGDIHLSRRVSDVITECLTDDLLAGGLQVVQSGEDVTIEVVVERFWVQTDTTPLYWDVIGEISLNLTTASRDTPPASRPYGCQQRERTYARPSAELIGKVLDACLAELGAKLRTNPAWRHSHIPKSAPVH